MAQSDMLKALTNVCFWGQSGPTAAYKSRFMSTRPRQSSSISRHVTNNVVRMKLNERGPARGRGSPAFFERLCRRLRATPLGSFVGLPLALAPALERPTRRVIARVPCLGGLMAATPSGICRGRLNGNGGTSQETSNSRSQKHFLPHRLTPFHKIAPVGSRKTGGGPDYEPE